MRRVEGRSSDGLRMRMRSFKEHKVPEPFLEDSIANARGLMIDSPSFGFACLLVPRIGLFSAKRDTAPLTRHIRTC